MKKRIFSIVIGGLIAAFCVCCVVVAVRYADFRSKMAQSGGEALTAFISDSQIAASLVLEHRGADMPLSDRFLLGETVAYCLSDMERVMEIYRGGYASQADLQRIDGMGERGILLFWSDLSDTLWQSVEDGQSFPPPGMDGELFCRRLERVQEAAARHWASYGDAPAAASAIFRSGGWMALMEEYAAAVDPYGESRERENRELYERYFLPAYAAGQFFEDATKLDADEMVHLTALSLWTSSSHSGFAYDDDAAVGFDASLTEINASLLFGAGEDTLRGSSLYDSARKQYLIPERWLEFDTGGYEVQTEITESGSDGVEMTLRFYDARVYTESGERALRKIQVLGLRETMVGGQRQLAYRYYRETFSESS